MRGQIAQAANTHIMKIGSSLDCKEWWHEKCSSYEGSEHLYATTAKFSGCVLMASRPAYSYPPRRALEEYSNLDLKVAFPRQKIYSIFESAWMKASDDSIHLILIPPRSFSFGVC
ncbi:hypothetical protein AVEN_132273-1 [Araneus ventricosus]|uniref:Uncharacterized protein n=1 Tax=Araneus ventricosus TaxID=182803 RepID=A0A4Y2JNG0_ARAVE|nr:hypothetical protein AVEN_132273-1 [Araneus ventricosus]